MALIGSSTQKEKSFLIKFKLFALLVFPRTNVYKISVIGNLKKTLPRSVKM